MTARQRMPNGGAAQPAPFGLREREDDRKLGHDAASLAKPRCWRFRHPQGHRHCNAGAAVIHKAAVIAMRALSVIHKAA